VAGAVGRKVRRVGALQGETPSLSGRGSLGSRDPLPVRGAGEKGREGDPEREMLSGSVERREHPRGPKGPREHVVPPRVNLPGSEEGHSCPGGTKPLERRCQAERFGKKAQERSRALERGHRSPGRKKALEGEAHERWGLKEASEGSRR
jgi:hypothetical protein